MNAPNEKDYLDAKLQAVIERVNGDARAHQTGMEARLEKFEQMIGFTLKSMRDEFDTRFARMEARIAEAEAKTLRAIGEVAKWIIGITVAIATIAVSIISAIFIYAIPKAAPAVAYIQAPVPMSAPAHQTPNLDVDKPNHIRK